MNSDITQPKIEVELNAAIVVVRSGSPRLLVVNDAATGHPRLPFGRFDPARHRTLEMSLRTTVRVQAGLSLGYAEQLYTFADRGRHAVPGHTGPHIISVGYLALTRLETDANEKLEKAHAEWCDWYRLFPWEDWRQGRPEILDSVILPPLLVWTDAQEKAEYNGVQTCRRAKLRLAFGLDGVAYDMERALERYELLYEAGLVEEAVSDGRVATTGLEAPLGLAMNDDHRRIVATAITRLRGKLKYRPVIFEMMPKEFTMTDLQVTVEAILGQHLHKQNFRRLIEASGLVETTGRMTAATGGRPAALFRFHDRVLDERPVPSATSSNRTQTDETPAA